MSDPDPHNLQRFVDEQDDGSYERAHSELSAGRKRSHWMWYVFPQIEGLGSSYMAQKFAIQSREEALAYLAHPILGARLRELTRIVNGLEGRRIHEIFHDPDDMKFRSSMTLFAAVTDDNAEFRQALEKYFEGEPDRLTLQRL
jgi:uncharacterized protein (DUF1810 family)